MDTVTDIKLRRSEWLGYLIRIKNNRIPKTLLDAKLDRKRKAGRPKLRWLDDSQTDLKITGIKGWRRKNQDRSKLMDVIREAEVKLPGA
jgi:hypothetical protein